MEARGWGQPWSSTPTIAIVGALTAHEGMFGMLCAPLVEARIKTVVNERTTFDANILAMLQRWRGRENEKG